MIVKWILHLFMLCVCSVEDMKEKEISLWKIVVYAVIVSGYGLWEFLFSGEKTTIWFFQGVMGSIPGMLLLLLGKLSGEAVGYGDGLLAVLIGISMGFWETMGILMTAFCAVFFAAGVIFIKNRKIKDKELPFAPFLLLGMAGAGLWAGI